MKSKKLSRVIAMAVAAALAAGSLAACDQNGGGGSAAPAGSGTSTGEKVALKMAMWDKDQTSIYLDPVIKAFTKDHPNVTVEMTDLGASEYTTALTTQLAGGSSDFDLVAVKDIPGYVSMAKAGQLEDLTQTIADKGLKDEDFKGVLGQMKYSDGKTYAIPFRNDFWVTFYNKKIFKDKGVTASNDITFAQYDEMARKLTSGSGNNKVYGCYYHTWASTIQLFGILDGKNTVLNGLEGKDYTFLKPYYEAVLKQTDDGICPDYASAKSSSMHYKGVFENGQAAMVNMGAWFLPTLISDIKNGKADTVKDNWGIMKYPHPDGVKAGTTIGTLTSLAVAASSKHKEEAKDFVAFMGGKDGAELVAKAGFFPAYNNSATVDALKQMEGFPTDEISEDALSVEKAYLEFPVTPKAAELNTRFKESHDAIMTKAKSVDDGLAQMKTDAEALR